MYASTWFFSALLCGFIIMIVGLTFREPLLRLLGSPDTILPYAKDYTKWILIAAPVMTTSCVLNNVLRYEGKESNANEYLNQMLTNMQSILDVGKK